MMRTICVAALMLLFCLAGPLLAAPTAPSTPTALWLFDDGTGTDVADSIGGQNGTLVNPNGSEWVSDANRKFGYAGDYAMRFDDNGGSTTSDYVSVADFDYYGAGSGFAVSFWFRVADNSGSAYQYMFSHGAVNTANSINFYDFENSAGGTVGQGRISVRDGDDSANVYQDALSNYGDGAWHLVVISCIWDDDSGGEVNTGGLRFYMDGVLQASVTNRADDTLNPAGGIIIGMRQDNDVNRRLDGWMDEVAIWSQPLNQDNVDWLWNSGAGNSLSAYVVPEPATLGLLVLGGMALAGSAYRRRRP